MRIFIIVITLLFPFLLIGQCPTTDVTLATQAQIDAWKTTYPNCTTMYNNVKIKGADITNLDSLHQIDYIGKYLSIDTCSTLTSLAGLSSLTSIGGNGGGLNIRGNAQLSSLQGLNALTYVNYLTRITGNSSLTSVAALSSVTNPGNSIIINNNPVLTSLSGFSSVTSIGNTLEIKNNAALTTIGLTSVTYIDILELHDNPALTSLNGLTSVKDMRRVHIKNNTSLNDISNLSSLTKITGIFPHLIIESNPMLTNLNGLENLTTLGNGTLDIDSNTGLSNISGIQNIAHTTISNLKITNNSMLSTCNVTNVCAYVAQSGSNSTISGNATGCATVPEVVIACNPCPSVTISTDEMDNTLCAGEDIVLTASMTGSASFLWSSGETTAGITKMPTSTTTYTVTVTGGNGCTNTASQEVTVNATPTASISTNDMDNTICSGASIVLTASGGTSYLWSSGETTAGITKMPTSTTTYTVTVTDGNGCTNTASQEVTVNPQPTASISTNDMDNTICSGASIVLTASGGTSYLWSSGETTAGITKMPTSTTTYTVTVTGGNGCTNTASQEVTVNPQPTASISTNDMDNTICSGASIVLTASGGTSYLWSSGETTAGITKMPTATTTYAVTVTGGNGCTNTASQEVTVNPQPTASISTNDMDNTICSGASIVLTASGGTSYLWSSGETTAGITKMPTSTTTYTVTVTDGNGCTNTASQEVTVNAAPTASISTNDMDNTICSGESIILTASGGASYLWSSGETTAGITKMPTSTTTYTVTVTGGNGCTNTASQEVTVNAAPTVAITTDEPDNSITVGEDVVLTATGGGTYAWNTGGTTAVITVMPTVTTTYTVTVTGSNGCTNTASQTITVTGPQCPSSDVVLTTQAEVDQFKINYPNCTSITTSLKITVSGSDITNLMGLSNLTYHGGALIIKDNPMLTDLSELSALTSIGGNGGWLEIDNNATLASLTGLEAVTSINSSITIKNNPLLVNLDGLAAASYAFGYGELRIVNNAILNSISAIDGVGTYIGIINIVNNPQLTTLNGLQNVTSTGAWIHIEDNASLTDISMTSLTKIWGDMSIKNNASLVNLNGLSALTKIESSGLTIEGNAMLSDMSGLVIDTLVGSLTIKNNPVLTSLNGFSNLVSLSNNGLNIESNPLLTNISGVQNILSTTLSSLTITGNPALAVCEVTNVCAYVSQSGNNSTISGNAPGCSTVQEVVIACNPCPSVTISTDEMDNTLCSGEDIVLTASMTGSVSFLWSSGETTAAITKMPTVTTTYTVTVTGGNGCTNTASQEVTVNPQPTASISTNDMDNTICSGASIVLTASGGTSYLWSSGETTAGITKMPTSTTTYTVTVTDGNGCTNTASQEVTVNAAPTASISTNDMDNTICSGESIILTASGGASYLWSSGETTAGITKMPTSTTTYTVTVTGGNGCTNTASQEVTVNAAPTVAITTDEPDNSITVGEDVVLTATGGGTYAWNTGGTTAVITVMPTVTTTYTVTVTGSNGCTNTASQTITVTGPQCPSSDVVLTTQAEVDQFKINYPNCTSITTSLKITVSGSDITNLMGLSNLTYHGGALIIKDNPMLTDLSELSALTSIGGNGGWLEIDNNATLASLTGLEAVTSINSSITIKNNPLLVNLDGLAAASYAFGYGELRIVNNAILNSISAIDGVGTYIGIINIVNNPQLTTLNGLQNVTSTGAWIHIEDNASLTDISMTSLTKIWGDMSIKNNASLVNLNGLSALTKIESSGLTIEGNAMLSDMSGLVIDTLVGSLTIKNNSVLTNLNGFSNLVSLSNNGLNIESNPLLTNISGVQNILSTTLGSLRITGNSVLAVCEVTNVCAYISQSGSNSTISGNATGCSTVQEVIIACNPCPSVTISTDEMDNTLCAGEDIVLTASMTGSASFLWSSGETTAGITKMPTSTTTYTVTVTGGNGCTNTASQEVTVNAAPTASISTNDMDNTLCNGESIILTASGGTSYLWSSGETTAGITKMPTSTTTYTVTVTDGNGCTNTASQEVTVNAAPTASISTNDMDNTICSGASIVLTASGGTSYLWSSGETTAGITKMPTATTTYTVSVTDGNGCTNIASQEVTVNAAPTASISTNDMDNTLCSGESIILTASGGTSYLWSSGETTAAITKIPTVTTTYTVTVTDGNGCTNTASQEVTVNALPTVSITSSEVDNTICLGESATLTASGGIGYLWSTGETTVEITKSPNSTTTYSVTVTNSEECSAIASQAINVDPLPIVMISSSDTDNTICNGNTITLTASGGTGYLWSSGETTAAVTKMPTATTTYTVTVTDGNGCTNTATQQVTVNALPTASIMSSDSDNTLCTGESITLTASGGASYVWATGETVAAITKTPTANTTYTVTITDANGCTATTSQMVTVNPLPTAVITSNDSDNAICLGGIIILTASGGTGYQWSTGETTAEIIKMPTINTTYTVTVTDGNGCSITSTQEVLVNPLPTIAISSVDCAMNLLTYSIQVNTTLVDALTSTSGTVTGSGNSYTISNIPAGTNVTLTGTNNTTMCMQTLVVNSPNCSCPTINAPTSQGNQEVCSGQPNPALTTTVDAGLQVDWYDMATGGTLLLANNLSYTPTVTVVGTYTYYAEAKSPVNNCVSTTRTTISLTINALPIATINSSDTDNTICIGDNLTLTAVGGTNFEWSSGQTTAAITINPMTNTTYTVTVTDGNGCTNTASQLVTVNPLPIVNITSSDTDNIICAGESITLATSNGSEYLWSTGATTNSITVSPASNSTYTVTVTNNNGCINTATQVVVVNPIPVAIITSSDADNTICLGESISLTAAGGTSYVWNSGETTATITKMPSTSTSYTVTITDANGCTASTTQLVTVNPLPVVAITSGDPDNTICNGSSVNLTATGGATYVWSTGATQNTISVNPTATTTYTVTATDTNGCSSTGIITIELHPITVATIASTDVDNTVCLNESVTLTAAGGTSYNWSTGATTAAISVQPTATTLYQVTVTDANGCTGTSSQTIIVNPLPTATVSSDDDDDTICAGGTVMLTASEGDFYIWSTGQTTQGISVSPTINTTYMVTVTNANGCSNTAANSIVVNPLPTANITTNDTDNMICVGSSIELTASGGSTYAWSTGANTATITTTPTETTTYSVTVTDGNSCSAVAQQEVVIMTVPTLTFTNAECSTSLMTWSVSITTDNNTTVLTTAGTLTGSNTSYQITDIPVNTNIVVSSTNNTTSCFTILTITSPNCSCPSIDLPTNPVNQTICEGSTPVALMVTVPTGISVDWYDAATGGTKLQANSNSYTPMNTAVGTYTYYAEAINLVNGCTSLSRTAVTYTINNNPTGSINSSDTDNTICLGESITLTANGGNTYSWASGESTQAITVTPNMTTTYEVTITGATGCTSMVSQIVTVNSLPTASIMTDATGDKICVGDSIILTAEGEGMYVWNGGQTSKIVKVSPAITTTYMVTVTNTQGCTSTATKEVTVGALPIASIASSDSDNIICQEETVTLTASGGGTYAWSTNSTAAAIIVNPSTTTAYIVTVTSTDGCSSTAMTSIMVNPKPSVNISTSDLDNTICKGDSITLTAAGGSTYVWGNGSTLASIKVAPTVTTMYMVTVTNGIGCTAVGTQEVVLHAEPTIAITNKTCSDDLTTYTVALTATNITALTSTFGTVTGANGSYTIVGIPKEQAVSLTGSNSMTGCMVTLLISAPNCDCPEVMAAVSGGDKTICFGLATPELSVTTTGTLVADWYSNQSGGTLLSTGLTYIPTITTAGTYIYYVESRDPVTSCISTTRTLVKLTVLESPQAMIITNDTNNTICSGSQITLTATGGSSYLWSNSETSNAITVSPTTATTYSVTVTATSGCSEVTSKLVNVNAIPAVNIVAPDTICSGVTFDLIENGGAATAWNWTVNATTTNKGDTLVIQGGTLVSPEISLVVTDANGCTNSIQQTLNITPSEIFQSEFLIASSVCLGDSVKMIEHSNTNFTPTKVRWDFGDGNMSSEAFPTHAYAAVGMYNVKVTIWNSNCSSTSIEKTIEVKNCRIGLEGEGVFLNVYPNPVQNNGLINIKGESTTSQPVLVSISDSYGKIMHQSQQIENEIFTKTIDTNLPSGVYFLRVNWLESKEIKVRKLIVIE